MSHGVYKMTKTILKIPPRLDNWRGRLSIFINTCRDKKFSESDFNCGIFIGGAIEAETGVNPCGPVGPYNTINQGLYNLKSMGYGSIEKYLDDILTPHVHFSRASEGDIALIQVNKELVGGVITHGRVIMLGVEKGIVSINTDKVKKAYKV